MPIASLPACWSGWRTPIATRSASRSDCWTTFGW
jgi:hypothetical protein